MRFSLTQALNIRCHRFHIAIGHFCGNRAHYFGAIISAFASAKFIQLRVDIVGVLSRETWKLGGNALALRAVA